MSIDDVDTLVDIDIDEPSPAPTGPAVPIARWASVPAIEPRVPTRPWRPLVALAVACGGPAFRTFSIAIWQRGALVLLVGFVATLVMSALPERRWLARGMVAGLGGAIGAFPGGEATGLWMVGTLLLADWSVRGRRIVPILPPPDGGLVIGVVVLQAMAAWRGSWPLATIAPLVLTLLSLMLTLVGSFLGGRASRLADRVGRFAGRVVTVAGLGILGVLVVVLPSIGQRLVRWNPLASPHNAGSQWVDVERRNSRSREPWAPDNSIRGFPLRKKATRWLSSIATVAVIALVAAAINWLVTDNTTAPTMTADGNVIPAHAAFDKSPWWPEYHDELNWFMHTAFDPLDNPRIDDVSSKYINVRDGHRLSWTPPDCGDCRRLKVWLYGGSTAFGLGQRDEHTIASEIARLASDDGIAVDIVNRGIPGDLHWLESQRFAWDLAVEGTPDYVVFFDGINEMMGALHLQDLGKPTIFGPIDPTLDRARTRDLDEFGYIDDDDPMDGPGDATGIEDPVVEWLDAQALGQQAVERYETSRTLTRDLGTAHDVPIEYFWQGSRFTREPVPREPIGEPDGEAYSRRWWAAAIAALPDDVVDMSDALDDVREPVFYDEMHTNELGARVQAEVIYAKIEPALRQLLDEGPG